jgi:hypothetical protein
MDISTNKSVAEREDEGVVIQLKDVTGEPQYFGDAENSKPVTMTVAGTYSPTYRKAVAANRDKWLRQRSREMDGDQMDKQSLRTAAACIKGWDGLFSGGAPVPCTKDNVVALLDEAPWIREQVEAAMTDHASFFPKPSLG